MPTRNAQSLHVVLLHPEIPWNTGNVGRSCLAAGAQLHLIEPLGFSLSARQLKRAGLDYWPRVKPRLWSDWSTFEAQLPKLGEAFLFSSEGDRTLWSMDFPSQSVLVFGCESVGLPPELRQRYRQRVVRIPMEDCGLRSLNLSTAVGVALYEVVRQRRQESPASGLS